MAIFKGIDFVWIHDFKELKKSGANIFQNHVLKEDYNKDKKDWYNAVNNLRLLEEEIEKIKLDKISKSELLGLSNRFLNKIREFWLPTLPAELGNYGAIDVLTNKLKVIIKDNNQLEEAIRVLTTSEIPTFYQKEEFELQEATNIREHQKGYFWLRNSYANVEYLDGNFFIKRKKELKPKIREEFNRR